ncbi:MAG: hypothetical protein CMN87_12215 [Stappia sp.]|nr:hypothetical protein [Stappia sp.]
MLALFVQGARVAGRSFENAPAAVQAFGAGRFVSDADFVSVAGWCGVSGDDIRRTAGVAAARDGRLFGNGRVAA